MHRLRAGICGPIPAGLSIDGIRGGAAELTQPRLLVDPDTSDYELYLTSLGCPGAHRLLQCALGGACRYALRSSRDEVQAIVITCAALSLSPNMRHCLWQRAAKCGSQVSRMAQGTDVFVAKHEAHPLTACTQNVCLYKQGDPGRKV